MAKFHVNPTTGVAGVCRGIKHCPFGDIEKDHYPTADEAREAYEKTMETFQTDFELEDDFVPKRSYETPLIVVPSIKLHKEMVAVDVSYDELKVGDTLPSGAIIKEIILTTPNSKYVYFNTDGEQERHTRKEVAFTKSVEMTVQEGILEQRLAEVEFAREEIALNVLPRGIFKRLNKDGITSRFAKLVSQFDKFVEDAKENDKPYPYTSAWQSFAGTDAATIRQAPDLGVFTLLYPIALFDNGDSDEAVRSKSLMRFLMNEPRRFGNGDPVPRSAKRALSPANFDYLKKLHAANPTNSVQKLLDD